MPKILLGEEIILEYFLLLPKYDNKAVSLALGKEILFFNSSHNIFF